MPAGTVGADRAKSSPDTNRRRLSWLLLAITIALAAAVLLLDAAGCDYVYRPEATRPASAFGQSLFTILAVCFGGLGALVTFNRPHNRVGWLMQATGLGLVIASFMFGYGFCGASGALLLPYGEEIWWLGTLVIVIPFMGIITLFMLFPDGRFLSPRWLRLTLLLITVLFIVDLTGHLVPGPIGEDTLLLAVENPFGVEGLRRSGLQTQLTLLSTLISSLLMLLAIISLFLRWRRADLQQRQQLKGFVFFVATAAGLFFAVEAFGSFFYPDIFDGWFYLLVLVLFFLGLPVVLTVAVLRYRLYDIDIIIRRTLVYGSLTIVLVVIYLGAVLLAQSAFVAATGQESPLAIVISTLAIAALFNPLRLRIQAFIDRRFYRQKYDAAQMLARYAQLTRDEVELQALSHELLSAVQQTVQPESLVLWLAGDLPPRVDDDPAR